MRAEVNEGASALLRDEVLRPKNQHQVRKVTLSDNGGVHGAMVVPDAVPPHSSNGPPSPELMVTIHAYHDAIYNPFLSPTETQPSFNGDFHDRCYRSKSGSAIAKMREMMKSVNAALGFIITSGVIPENESEPVLPETEQLRTVGVDSIVPPPMQRRL